MSIPLVMFVVFCAYSPITAADTEHINGASIVKNASKCGSQEFRCRSGQCIPGALVCDGLLDCVDGSDETHNACNESSVSRCTPRHFRCDYGACVSGDAACNGIQNCADNSDENPATCKRGSSVRKLSDHEITCPILKSDSRSVECIIGDKPIPCDNTGVAPGIAAKLTCRENHIRNSTDLTARDVVKCNTKGKWEPKPINCIKDIPCQPLRSKSRNADCTLPTGDWIPCMALPVPYGTSAKLICRNGYAKDISNLVASDRVQCNDKGIWEPEPIDCVTDALCPSLESVSRLAWCISDSGSAIVSCEDRILSPGTSANLSCRNGYIQDVTNPDARANVVCNLKGKWEPEPIKCSNITDYVTSSTELSTIVNQHSTELYEEGEHITRMTLPFGQTKRPTSFIKKSCSLPPQPQNGHYLLQDEHCPYQPCKVPSGLTDVEPGSSLLYACYGSYKLSISVSRIYCSSVGTWPIIPICKEITCPPLPSVSRNADCTLPIGDSISCMTLPVPFGTLAKLTCRNGYAKDTSNLVASDRVQCKDKGNWEPKPINCVTDVLCPSLESVSRLAWCIWDSGSAIESCEDRRLSPGTSANLSCRNGYIQDVSNPDARANVVCNLKGKWEPEPIKCLNITDYVTSSTELSTIVNRHSTESYEAGEHTTRMTPPFGQTQRPTSFNKKSCSLPPQPQNGHYLLLDHHCPYQPCEVPFGMTEVDPGASLLYACYGSYKLSISVSRIFCSTIGNWSAIPVCEAITCPPLASASRVAECTQPTGGWIMCESTPVPPGTSANLICRNSYVKDTKDLTTFERVKCNTVGEWEPKPINCLSVCGVASTSMVTPLVVNGSMAHVAEFPWHGTLYRKINFKKEFICGATIIKENMLVTAAHCVYDDRTKKVDEPGQFYVSVGNLFRVYDHKDNDPHTFRTARVTKIYVQCHYLGIRSNYAMDIAILVIDEPLVFSSLLMPICLDVAGIGDIDALEVGNYLRVPGFGRSATGEPSEILQTITVPYVSQTSCRAMSAERDYEKFFTQDKFCAGYTNGSSVCDGDSGGGLVYKTNGKWYLRGIVSMGIGSTKKGGTTMCDSHTYAFYTRISNHMNWVQTVMRNEESKKPQLDCH